MLERHKKEKNVFGPTPVRKPNSQSPYKRFHWKFHFWAPARLEARAASFIQAPTPFSGPGPLGSETGHFHKSGFIKKMWFWGPGRLGSQIGNFYKGALIEKFTFRAPARLEAKTAIFTQAPQLKKTPLSGPGPLGGKTGHFDIGGFIKKRQFAGPGPLGSHSGHFHTFLIQKAILGPLPIEWSMWWRPFPSDLGTNQYYLIPELVVRFLLRMRVFSLMGCLFFFSSAPKKRLR